MRLSVIQYFTSVIKSILKKPDNNQNNKADNRYLLPYNYGFKDCEFEEKLSLVSSTVSEKTQPNRIRKG